MLAEPVDSLQDLDRLPAELSVEAPEVLLRELAGGPVGLGVADLAVLGLLFRLELGEFRVRAVPLPLLLICLLTTERPARR